MRSLSFKSSVYNLLNSTLKAFDNSSKKIEEMGRVRKKIAEHMVHSQQTSPHVYSVMEADVTSMVNARESSKQSFYDKYGEEKLKAGFFNDGSNI